MEQKSTLTEELGHPSLTSEDREAAVLYHLNRRKAFRDRGMPQTQGANPARQGYGGEAAGLQKGGHRWRCFVRSPIRAYLAVAALRDREEGQALVEYALPALPDRDRFDHDPHRAWQERLGDLQQRSTTRFVATSRQRQEGLSRPLASITAGGELLNIPRYRGGDRGGRTSLNRFRLALAGSALREDERGRHSWSTHSCSR